MALHDSLRDLVSVRGAGVVDEAEEFRGVLDDFLAEDEATLGELNLLVDAVRLGALRRVLDVMAHGAAPEAAIREAGAALARDRGTDDPTRSCWALASLCFALGKVDEPLVRSFLGETRHHVRAGAARSPRADRLPPGDVRSHDRRASDDRGAPRDAGPSRRCRRPSPPTATAAGSPGYDAYAGPVPPVIRRAAVEPGRGLPAGGPGRTALGGLVATGSSCCARTTTRPRATPRPTAAAKRDSSSGADDRWRSDDEMLVPYVAGRRAFSTIYRSTSTDGTSARVTGGPSTLAADDLAGSAHHDLPANRRGHRLPCPCV